MRIAPVRRRSPHAPRPRAFRAPARPASPRKSDGRHSVTLPRPALTRARASCRRMPGCAWHSMPEKCAPFGPDRSSFVTEWWGAARGHSRVTHPLTTLALHSSIPTPRVPQWWPCARTRRRARDGHGGSTSNYDCTRAPALPRHSPPPCTRLGPAMTLTS